MHNNLPLNWCECKLGDVSSLVRGVSYQKSDLTDKNNPLGICLLRANNIQDGKIVYDDLVYVNRSKVTREQNLCAGDIIIAMSSGSKHLVGKSAQFMKYDRTTTFGAFCGTIRPNYNINNQFIRYFFQTKEYQQTISMLSKGSNINNLKREHILTLMIPLPPLAEQERIVEKIEALFQDIDEGVERLKSAQAQIKQYRQSVLKSAFEGKLYKTTDWKEVQLKDVCANIQYGYTESSNSSPIGPKFLRITDIQNDSVNWDTVPYCKISKEALNKYKLQKGDFVFARTGATVGKSYLLEDVPEKTIFASYLIRVRFNTQTVSKFIKYFFQSPRYWLQIIDKQAGIGQPNVNGTKLGQLEIILPTLPEQQRIVEEIEKRFAVADELEKAVNEGLEKADKLKQSILKKAFEGKLAPQNPNDEPASVLLERIKKKQIPTKGKKK